MGPQDKAQAQAQTGTVHRLRERGERVDKNQWGECNTDHVIDFAEKGDKHGAECNASCPWHKVLCPQMPITETKTRCCTLVDCPQALRPRRVTVSQATRKRALINDSIRRQTLPMKGQPTVRCLLARRRVTRQNQMGAPVHKSPSQPSAQSFQSPRLFDDQP